MKKGNKKKMKNKHEIENRIKKIDQEINRRLANNSKFNRNIIKRLMNEEDILKWVLEE